MKSSLSPRKASPNRLTPEETAEAANPEQAIKPATAHLREETDTPHYVGHRARLRARFLDNPDGLQDYELLEIVLGLAIPRRDVKPLAKDLLKEFGDLWSLVRAPSAQLEQFGLTDGVIVALRSIGEVAARGLKAQVKDQPVINSWDKLLDYCRAVMGAEKVEQFRLIFLDNKNKVMSDELQQRGTVNHTPAYPREIVKRALDLGASAIILVHNHPSGDPTPSKADIELTQDIIAAASPLGIKVHDHLIISRKKHASLKSLGLM